MFFHPNLIAYSSHCLNLNGIVTPFGMWLNTAALSPRDTETSATERANSSSTLSHTPSGSSKFRRQIQQDLLVGLEPSLLKRFQRLRVLYPICKCIHPRKYYLFIHSVSKKSRDSIRPPSTVIDTLDIDIARYPILIGKTNKQTTYFSDTVQLAWRPPQSPNGQITGYEVTYQLISK